MRRLLLLLAAAGEKRKRTTWLFVVLDCVCVLMTKYPYSFILLFTLYTSLPRKSQIQVGRMVGKFTGARRILAKFGHHPPSSTEVEAAKSAEKTKIQTESSARSIHLHVVPYYSP
jgi:hypothetical protein